MTQGQRFSFFILLAWLAFAEVSEKAVDDIAEVDDRVATNATQVSRISPSSISAGTATEISFTGASENDKVEFAASCNGITTPSSNIVSGKATVRKDTPGKLYLCYRAFGSNRVEEKRAIKLTVVAATGASVISAVSPLTVRQGQQTTVKLTGGKAGGKAIFVRENDQCVGQTPDTTLDAGGEGSFIINSAGGTYKLCYQAPGGSDSKTQSNIALTVLQTTVTKADSIVAISPSLLVVRVPTSITFTGAMRGGKAQFRKKEQGCAGADPEKDVGSGHNMFTILDVGTYVLCYRAPGADDAVKQTGVTLNVREPGVVQAMLNRWSSKHGTLDCNTLTQVPYCSVSGISECEKTYFIWSGIGYKCFWDTKVWPPACDVSSNSVDKAKKAAICQSGSCGGSPSQCW